MPDESTAVVIGAGMVTAIGLSAPETVANLRAGIVRFSADGPWDSASQPIVVAMVPNDGLPELDIEHVGPPTQPLERRLLRLATLPLEEALRPLRQHEPVHLYMALPELQTSLDTETFVTKLLRQTDVPVGTPFASYRGRAGGVAAVGDAAKSICEGRVQFALAGAVDSYLDLMLLTRLESEGRINSERQPNGFVPGEGAAFVLLASKAAAEQHGLTWWATVTTSSSGFEAGHLYSDEVYRGEGLSTAFTSFFSDHEVPSRIKAVYSSMNGENFWAKEFGIALGRSQDRFEEDLLMHHHADSVGDLGAGCGPLSVGFAAHGIGHGYGSSPSLVYASSDAGDRAVLAVI